MGLEVSVGDKGRKRTAVQSPRVLSVAGTTCAPGVLAALGKTEDLPTGRQETDAIGDVHEERGQVYRVTRLGRYGGNLSYDGNGLFGTRPERDPRAQVSHTPRCP